MAAASPCLTGGDRKHWWLTNRKVVGRYIREARTLMAAEEHDGALWRIDAALALSPRLELALELKARCLLQLRRFKAVADMLQDHIPSLRLAASAAVSGDDSGSVSSDGSSRERVRLLAGGTGQDAGFKCFSVSDLKKKVLAGLSKNCDKDAQWRYTVLGQACCHLGLMEDALVLLQTGKRLASAAFRRESICWSDDSFSYANFPFSTDSGTAFIVPPGSPSSKPLSESEFINQLLTHIKLLLRRRTAALAARDAGLYSEAIRIFGKIVDGRRGAPQGFLAECYMGRAVAYMAAGRVAESIGDCNRTLALDQTSIQALDLRSALFESIRCLPDCLHDLEHLKLLYNSILRDRKLPGPVWKRHNIQYREIPGKLCALTVKIQELKKRIAGGEKVNVDYHALIGLRRGCSRSELERAHLLLTLRHKPDKAVSFLDRCEFSDDRDLDSIRDRAKMSAQLLYRLLQKGYTSVMSNIIEAEKQRKQNAAVLQPSPVQTIEPEPEKKPAPCPSLGPMSDVTPDAAEKLRKINAAVLQPSAVQAHEPEPTNKPAPCPSSGRMSDVTASTPDPASFQGVFCRDMAVVSSLLSQVGFNRPLPVKYEGLSC